MVSDSRLGLLRTGLILGALLAIAVVGALTAAPAAAQDIDPPDTFIFSGPAEGSTTGDSTPRFDFGSSEFPSTFECELDDGGFTSCDSPYTTPTLSDGEHTFRVRAIDESNNVDPIPDARTFTVEADLDPPETTIDDGPGEGDTFTDPTPTFSFSSDEFSSTFECRIDTDPFEPCSWPHTTAHLSDGEHTFEVKATDEFGNTDPTPATRTFTLVADVDPPETTIDSGPGEGATILDATPEFTFSADEPSSFECELDDGGFTSCDSPYTTPTLSDGEHTFEVRAVDEVDNPDPTPATRTFTVDAGAVISNGTVQLGVNAQGSLNFECAGAPDPACPDPSQGGIYRRLALCALEPESTAPGCLCEGWGVADAASGLTGFANQADGDGNITIDSFATPRRTSAISTVTIADPGMSGHEMQVEQDYHPSPLSANLYMDSVTMTNTGSDPLADLRYRRVMDWDIEPTAFRRVGDQPGDVAAAAVLL